MAGIATVKAIQTVHNGNHYRSRLEARWAVFFDALGIPYRYEHEGYDLGDGVWYLPDFYLTEDDVWLEIKGQQPSISEINKMNWLIMGTNTPGAILAGLPDEQIGRPYLFIECHECGRVTPASVDNDELYIMSAAWCYCGDFTHQGGRVFEAGLAARQARFEHGR